MKITGLSNGQWLLGIDDAHDMYEVTLLPGKKISVLKNGSGFTCSISEVNIVGKVVLIMTYSL